MASRFTKKPELLAPAGSRAAFEAALAAGADAVYLGMGAFNARRNADNFSACDLAAACHDAHLRARAVYLTANTLIFPGEMDEAIHMVSTAAEAGIDAVIVQDVGLMSALRRELPELKLHASTQMNIRDKAGIELASTLGATRVTLARELSIERIAELAKCGMDLEVFVHGALCICQSGQCLFSSLIGGRSANRGLCAQPCRLAYTLVDAHGKKLADPGKYLLSLRDLCGIELVEHLIDAGVASLKIEGRMKSPEYVSTVTHVYRNAIDRACKDDEPFEVKNDERVKLAEAFSRGFSTGYLCGECGSEMMSYKRPNNRGIALGRVAGFKDGFVRVNTCMPIYVDDVLEVWTSKGKVTHKVNNDDDLSSDKPQLRIRGAVALGDRIFRLRSAKLQNEVRKRTKWGFSIPVCIHVKMRIGEPLEISISSPRGAYACVKGEPIEAALTKVVTREDIIEHVGRLGATPFYCESFDIELDQGCGISFSTLHKVRAQAVKAYEAALLKAWDDARCTSDTRAGPLDIYDKACADDMAAFVTSIDFTDTDIALCPADIRPGCSIGPKLYATNLYALQTWAALGVKFAWLSPELTLHQIKLLADKSPIGLGIIVSGRQELMISDHCFLMAEGPCKRSCSNCARRREKKRYYRDRLGYLFPVTADASGRGHLYNAVPLDIVHAVGELLRAGVRGFAVDTTLMDDKQKKRELARVRAALSGRDISKEKNTTTGHLFARVR